jgi:hypothetical protein
MIHLFSEQLAHRRGRSASGFPVLCSVMFGNYVEVISLTAGRPPGFLSLSHGLHDGLAGHSRHENHHGDTHPESANDRQIV